MYKKKSHYALKDGCKLSEYKGHNTYVQLSKTYVLSSYLLVAAGELYLLPIQTFEQYWSQPDIQYSLLPIKI